jgi:ATP-dependent DNA helicase RecG
MNEDQFKLPFLTTSLLGPDEIYATADQSSLPVINEGRRLERKPAGVHPKALGDYFSIWANTAPSGGLIVIGVENDGSITGCSRLSPARVNDLERAGHVYCPDARYEAKHVPVTRTDGVSDFLILIRVHYNDSKVVETVDGTAYTRVGESKKKRL